MNLENPIQFDTEKILNDNKINYSNLIEICQGGPEIGNLSVNGKLIEKHRFGGPCILSNTDIFVPMYVKSFFYSGFKLAKINIKTLKINILGKSKNLIFLDRIENDKIYFHEDLEGTVSGYYVF